MLRQKLDPVYFLLLAGFLLLTISDEAEEDFHVLFGKEFL